MRSHDLCIRVLYNLMDEHMFDERTHSRKTHCTCVHTSIEAPQYLNE